MIRVTRIEHRSRTILTVDGELSGESVAIVETCCKQAESDGKPVEIFLRDVDAVGEDGRLLLIQLASRGVRLTARGVYTSYLIEKLASTKKDRPPAHNASTVPARMRASSRHLRKSA